MFPSFLQVPKWQTCCQLLALGALETFPIATAEWGALFMGSPSLDSAPHFLPLAEPGSLAPSLGLDNQGGKVSLQPPSQHLPVT